MLVREGYEDEEAFHARIPRASSPALFCTLHGTWHCYKCWDLPCRIAVSGFWNALEGAAIALGMAGAPAGYPIQLYVRIQLYATDTRNQEASCANFDKTEVPHVARWGVVVALGFVYLIARARMALVQWTRRLHR